ncbi:MULTISPECIES: hypothetical protein [Mycolicibacterium]|jgi:hypothetical protein|uniref:hypothetical protein n=1 Tax=Mycolicibacterium TaxID=1866885 RepID=UPI0015CC4772|nr:hypothetical protein [Mycolicibacterium vinylchloridicum]
MTIPPATAANAADEPARHTRENDTSSVKLAAFVAKGDVLADGRVVRRRWSMPVPIHHRRLRAANRCHSHNSDDPSR